MKTVMVLLAAGAGKRMRAAENKILLMLAGKTLLEHSLAAVCASGAVDAVILVARECDIQRMQALTADCPLPLDIVEGGAERQDSVKNALAALPADTEIVAVHDAWVNTSASECPASPRAAGISTPPKINARPSANRCASYPCPILIFLCSRIKNAPYSISRGSVILMFADSDSTSCGFIPIRSASIASSVP